MTPIQIAYFKHFLYDTGLNKMYVYRYRHHRFEDEKDMSGNPESIEQFFLQVPYHKALTKAFYVQAGSQYGIDFWKEQEKKWKKYWKLNEDNLSNQSYLTLKGGFGILRQNWDLPAFWRKENYESNEETYKRMGIEPPIPLDSVSTLCKFKVDDIIQSTISDEVQTIMAITPEGYVLEDEGIVAFDKEEYWIKIDERCKPESVGKLEKVKAEPEEKVDKPVNKEDISGVSEFDNMEFFDVCGGSKMRSNRLKDGQGSLNFRSGSYKFTFNNKDTKKIKQNEYKYVRLGQTTSGDIILQLHKQTSIGPNQVNLAFNSNKEGRVTNACVNSKHLCSKLKELLDLIGDYFVLKVEELYMDYEKANYKISK